ncbi:MAG TPA: DNA polymerase/3'-5' exonuclease PolX [Terriglobia bacterium]|nr:DNA polymerase/3'-5' exonuclease PolX [Terriglobia bacterium]
MENHQIAAVFEEVANVIRILQDDPKWQFKAVAYERAKRSIESYSERLEDIARDPRRKLTDIPGVGTDFAAKIREILSTGKLQSLEEKFEKLPRSLLDLLYLPTVGPQKVRLFYEKLGIKTLDDLEDAARGQRLRELAGMSTKSEENILRAIEGFKKGTGRFRLDTADEVAEQLAQYLLEIRGVEKVTAAGSLRRGRDTVGDLDLLVTGKDLEKAADQLLKRALPAEVLARGDDKVSFRLPSHLQVDVRLLPPESFGAALMYFTGSKEHNVALRARAQRQGLKLSEYGLFRGEEIVAGRTEEEVYQALGLPWIPPELRENMGEIEAAAEGRLPHLVDLEDIRGDLQMHTTASDGKKSVEEMAAAARELGYRYILITDHSQAVTIANGLDETRARENIKKIRAARKKVSGIEIWAGAEVDIMGDGTLDYPDDLLAEFDIVLASIHSRMTQPAGEITRRLLRALENPYVRILGHPTGRYILRRDPMNFDVEAVFQAAKKHGVVMEVNASPERLDLSDRHARLAHDQGMKIVISTDAHQPRHFMFMRYGVITARRGWTEKKDVINTYPPAKLLESLRPLPGK